MATLRDVVEANVPYPQGIHFVRNAANFALGQRAETETELARLRAIVAADRSPDDARHLLRELELHWMS